MPDTPSILLAKTFNYRGASEVYTNKYHFSGTTPTSPAEWLALGTAIWNSERPALSSTVRLTGLIGYAAGNEAAVYLRDQAGLGAAATTGTAASSEGFPGDVAMWVRWSTNDRNTKNKPIYLRKYFHGFGMGATKDQPAADTRTALIAHGAKMMDGSLPGGVKISGPQGAAPTASSVPTYVTTRTLKRNGRSPI